MDEGARQTQAFSRPGHQTTSNYKFAEEKTKLKKGAKKKYRSNWGTPKK